MSKRLYLTLTDFHSVYLISHLLPYVHEMRDAELRRVIAELEFRAGKLLRITRRALHHELRHWRHGSSADEFPTFNFYGTETTRKERRVAHNTDMINNRFTSIRNFIRSRESGELSYAECLWCFKNLHWDSEYGGMRWVLIVEAAAKLEAMMPLFSAENVREFVVQYDHIIDLEHNNDLFLRNRVSFYFKNFLRAKSHMDPVEFVKAPAFIKNYWRKYCSGVKTA